MRVPARAAILPLLFLLAAASPAFAQEGEGPSPSLPPSPPSRLTVLAPETEPELDPAVDAIARKFDRDLDYLVSSPFRLTPRGAAWAAGTAALTLVLQNDDGGLSADLAGQGGSGTERACDRLGSLGRNIPEAALALLVGGYLLDSRELQSDALQGVEAVALTALFSAVSAPVIGHAGPGQSPGPGDFRGFDRYHSMPDMETGMAFALAGAMGYGKGFWANLGLYSVAAGVGVSRAHRREAWPSDVFLGAALGAVIGRTVPWLSTPEGRVSFSPALFDAPSGPVAALGVTWEY